MEMIARIRKIVIGMTMDMDMMVMVTVMVTMVMMAMIIMMVTVMKIVFRSIYNNFGSIQLVI